MLAIQTTKGSCRDDDSLRTRNGVPQDLQALNPAPSYLPPCKNTHRRPNPQGERVKNQIAPHT